MSAQKQAATRPADSIACVQRTPTPTSPSSRTNFFEKLNLDCRLIVYDHLDLLCSGEANGLRDSCSQALVEISDARVRQLNTMIAQINKRGGLYGCKLKAEIERAADSIQIAQVIVTIDIRYGSTLTRERRMQLSARSEAEVDSDMAALHQLLSIDVLQLSLHFEISGVISRAISRELCQKTLSYALYGYKTFNFNHFNLSWRSNKEEMPRRPTKHFQARTTDAGDSLEAIGLVYLSETQKSGSMSFQATSKWVNTKECPDRGGQLLYEMVTKATDTEQWDRSATLFHVAIRAAAITR